MHRHIRREFDCGTMEEICVGIGSRITRKRLRQQCRKRMHLSGNFPHSGWGLNASWVSCSIPLPSSLKRFEDSCLEPHVVSIAVLSSAGSDVGFHTIGVENMVKAYRIKGLTETPRYKQLKAELIELGHKDGEITSRTFATTVGIFSESSARDWLVVFEADGIIKLVKRYQGGRKAYVLIDAWQATRNRDIKTQQNTTPKINLLNKLRGEEGH